jgi:nucleotide-binding universal stress UspA family protein
MIEIKRILIPVDFSDYSRHALQYAEALAEAFSAKLYLIHVREVPLSRVFPPEPYPSVVITEEQKQNEQLLRKLVEEIRGKGIDAEPIYVVGQPYAEIVKAAQELNIDLVTLATHGRKGVSHVIFGSVAEKVVRLAPCPVLTIKHPEHEFIAGETTWASREAERN